MHCGPFFNLHIDRFRIFGVKAKEENVLLLNLQYKLCYTC